jgi:DNA-binding MarR family transcriptional regulator
VNEASALRLGYLLKHAELEFGRLTVEKLEPLGINPREWAALSCLDDERGLSQREIADMLGVDRTTMVSLVDQLQGKGLIRRRRQPDDRRKNTLELTKKGRALEERGGRFIHECEQRFLDQLSDPEVRQLKSTLAKVIAAQ